MEQVLIFCYCLFKKIEVFRVVFREREKSRQIVFFFSKFLLINTISKNQKKDQVHYLKLLLFEKREEEEEEVAFSSDFILEYGMRMIRHAHALSLSSLLCHSMRGFFLLFFHLRKIKKLIINFLLVYYQYIVTFL